MNKDDIDEICEIDEMINKIRLENRVYEASQINEFLIKKLQEVIEINKYFVKVKCNDGKIYEIPYIDNFDFKDSTLIVLKNNIGEYPISILSVAINNETKSKLEVEYYAQIYYETMLMGLGKIIDMRHV